MIALTALLVGAAAASFGCGAFGVKARVNWELLGFMFLTLAILVNTLP